MSKVNERLLTVLLLLLMVSAVQYIMVDKTNVIRCQHPPRAYWIDVVDSNVEVYTEDDKLIGVVPLEGQLDSLITADNE